MKRAHTVIFGFLTLLLICFIWGQSMLPKSLSAGESSFLMRILKPLLDPSARIDDALFHHVLRKAAHFSEYAALGFCFSGFLWSLQWKARISRVPIAILVPLVIASIDESIQLFSEGRGAQIRDVLLDTFGALFGLAVYLILRLIVNAHSHILDRIIVAVGINARVLKHGFVKVTRNYYLDEILAIVKRALADGFKKNRIGHIKRHKPSATAEGTV